MCMEDNGKRMLSWDIVKGITILIMIVGHVASIPQQLRNFIFLSICRFFSWQMHIL